MLAFGILFSCQESKHSDLNGDSEFLAAVSDSLNVELTEIYRQGFINGFSVAIVNEDGAVYQHGFGLADKENKKEFTENTLLPIASISKTLIGIALLKAQEMGKIDLDHPVNKYLPFPVKNPYYPEDDITIRHLANHTSTIVDTDYYDETTYILENEAYKFNTAPTEILDYFNPPRDSISLFDFIQNLLHEKGVGFGKESFTNERPGNSYKYTNTGAALAALILELVTGVQFKDFTTEHILHPLGMSSSVWSTKDADTSRLSKLYSNADTVYAEYYCPDYPAGGLISSSNDLSKYLTELIKGYIGRGTLLTKESYRELYALEIQEDLFSELEGKDVNSILNIKYDKGIFMGLAPKNQIGHTGGDPGVSALMFFNSQTNSGRILMANRTIIGENEGALNELWTIWDKLEEYTEKLNQ